MKKISLLLILGFILLGNGAVFANEIYEEYKETWKAQVVNIVDEKEVLIEWNDLVVTSRTIELKFLEGPKKGEVIIHETDFPNLAKGKKVYVNYLVDMGGSERYAITNINRTGALITLLLIFVFAVLIFGGWQGLRSLVALIGSFAIIFYILIPGLLNGWNPLLASFLVAGGILFAAIFFTHGFNRESTVAYVGTMISVVLTGIFAVIAVSATSLSGFSSDESVYLNFNTQGALNFTALLLGAIIIGILGVLDDIAVTQAAVVTELYNANPNLTRKEVFIKAIRVGKEHVGALVNTLVLAYTGASLPLILLFYFYEQQFMSVINLEVFATEIVRTLIGSIGLIMCVPIVTFMACIYLKDYKPKHARTHHHHH